MPLAATADNLANLSSLGAAEFRNASEDLGAALSYKPLQPAKTPRPIIKRLNQVLVRMLWYPKVIKGLEAKGLSPSPSTTGGATA